MDKIIRFVSVNCLLIWILLGTAGSVSAQRFEWVRGYAAGENVAIVGSVTDSVGNLYILGSMNRNSCWENGSRLLPIVPQGGPDNGDVLIAKVSPEGDLVWHKVIHGNYTWSTPHDIKPLGDTAFACLVTMPLATTDYYLYYLDTMIHSGRTIWDPNSGDTVPWPDYPMSAVGVGLRCLALITFDFDGGVLEQHFLQMSFLKRDGEDIFYVIPPNAGANTFLNTSVPENPSFAIDSEGNIYLSRRVNDYTSGGPYNGGNYSLAEGTISAVKFWCDGRMVGVVPTDSALASSPQILKFAPHFDTLTNSRYVFLNECNCLVYTHLKIDDANRLFLLGDIRPYNNCNILVEDMTISIGANHHAAKSFLVQYDSLMNPEHLVCLRDSIVDTTQYKGTYMFHDFEFDTDSNLLFITGSAKRNVVGDTISNNSFYVLDDSVTSLQRNTFVLILEKENLHMRNYGQLSTSNRSNSETFLGASEQFVCNNNRIFLQYIYYGEIRFPNSIRETPTLYTPGIGLAVFDYRGDLIFGFDYVSYSLQNIPGSIALNDSVLYLTNRLASDATFGDIHVPSRGEYFACIAKYTDSMFMSSYERPRDTSIVVEVVQEELTVVRYPNPTTGRLTLVMNGRPLREAYVAGMDGIAQPLPVAAIGNGIYCADLTGRPDGTYILVLVADDKHAYRCNVILQH